MRRRQALALPLAALGAPGLGGCSHVVQERAWIVSAEIGAPQPPVLWVVVARANLREGGGLSALPGFASASAPAQELDDLRLHAWRFDLPSGQREALRPLTLESVHDGALSVRIGEWSEAGLTLSVAWQDEGRPQSSWWVYPADRREQGKGRQWRRLGAAPAAPGPAARTLWSRLSAAPAGPDAADLVLDGGRRLRAVQLDAQGEPVWQLPVGALAL